jgi:hypothetical protein
MYGYRFLFCLFPLALLGYALWSHQLQEQYQDFRHYPMGTQFCQVFLWVFCGYGLLGTLFWGLNENFMYYPGRNAFGVLGPTALGYQVRVIEGLPTLAVWKELIVTRTIGLFAYAVNDVPLSVAKHIEHYHCHFQNLPLRAYCQVIILGIFFVGGSIAFCKKEI